MKSYIKGIYKRSIYQSDKGYFIGLFKVFETDNTELVDFIEKTITFTGYFTELNEGDRYIFRGEEINHPRYGLQFSVSEYEKLKPEDKDGVIDFLSSSLFPKIGKKLATSIVETLGDNALDLIIEDSSCLNLVPKITQKKIDLIYNNLIKYDESRNIIVYLTELGFNMKDSFDIYNLYKKDSISIINNNVYRLIDDNLDISFLKIDGIGLKLNSDLLNKNRIYACIIYVMKTLVFKTGNTYLTYQEIYEYLCKYLGIQLDEVVFDNYLDELRNDVKIYIENNRYYLMDMYENEYEIINKIRILLNNSKIKYKKIYEYLNNLEDVYSISYNELQKKAIITALEENILIITGGPGTGKTTIVKAIIELYKKLNRLSEEELIRDLALLGPTGRSSKRLCESAGFPATTIHRFLKWNKESNSFAVNEYDKDYSKLIIIDEASMIDEYLLASLFRGLTDNIKVVFVGDYNQLPSVSPGQVLKDLIESNTIKTITLEQLYRQSSNSYIPNLATEIIFNELSSNFTDTKDDYTFLECDSYQIKSTLFNLCTKIIDKGYNSKNIQIIAPMYKGENGIDMLNKYLQNVFNPKDSIKNEIVVGDVIFRENDKVLQLINMPDNNVFNGDIGIIRNIITSNNSDSGKNEIYIDFDGNIVKYLPKDFNKFKHGYIISIHKSQGSEFDMVIMPIVNSYNRMLYRKLIYTGVTRAKKKLIIIGETEAFINAVNNDNELIRNTALKEKLVIMNNNLK